MKFIIVEKKTTWIYEICQLVVITIVPLFFFILILTNLELIKISVDVIYVQVLGIIGAVSTIVVWLGSDHSKIGHIYFYSNEIDVVINSTKFSFTPDANLNLYIDGYSGQLARTKFFYRLCDGISNILDIGNLQLNIQIESRRERDRLIQLVERAGGNVTERHGRTTDPPLGVEYNK